MLNKKSLLACLLALLLCLSFSIQAEILQYENLLVGRIHLQVMNVQEEAACDVSGIVARMKSREGNYFSQLEFDNDLKTLSRDFDRLEPSVEVVEGKVMITLKIWPKPIIRTITWFGNRQVDSSTLLKELGVPPGSVFDRQAFNQAFNKLKTYYVKQGYFEAQLNYDILLDAQSNQVDIQMTINEGRAGMIKKINFVNFTDAEQDELAEMIITKEYWLLLSWMTGEGTYHQEAMMQDEMTIVNYLQNKGFADARVNINICEAKEANRIIINIIADRGELYHIGKVSFSGNTIFINEQINPYFQVLQGNIYSPELIRDTTTKLTNLYGRFGYIDASINFEPKLSPNQCVYDIDFTIEEGSQFRVGLIKVFGNCATHTQVILHETFLIPGEVFNTEKLEKTEERLENIGYFKNVNVYAVKSEGSCSLGDDYRDVHIEVEETSTGHIGAFFGFSTSENVFGGINLTENNFNYKGIGSLLSKGPCALRGGGEFLHLTTSLGAKSRSYVISWSKPYFMDTPWIVGFDVERTNNRYVSNDYDINSTGFTLRGMYPINQFVKAGCHYRLRNTKINVNEDDDEPNLQLKREAKNSGLISAIGSSWIYDSTNHPIIPTEGFKSRVETELAGLGGKHAFLTVAYLNTYFLQFSKVDCTGVWKFRADARFIQPMSDTSPHDIPIDERYFLGGDETVRGFKPYQLGPKYPHSNDPRGGISMQYVSIEYSRPLMKRIEGFIFLDSGHLSMKKWNLGTMYTSVGYGLRVSIFPNAPPLMLAMGYPLNPKKRSDVKHFYITVGGRF